MLAWLSTIQFLNPLLLLGGLITPLLILAYLRRKPQKKLVVSSVFLFRDLTKRPDIRKKFKPPLRFFLELLALLLLCLAGGMPMRLEPRNKLAIVLDNSLSMRATIGVLSEKRFDAAKKGIEKWLSEQSSRSIFTLYLSSPKLAKVGADGLGKDEVIRELMNTQASLGNDNIESAVNELAETGEYEKIMVFSDRRLDYEGEGKEGEGENSALESLFGNGDAGGKPERVTRISGISVGSPVENVFISNLALAKVSYPNESYQLVATVSFSGKAVLPIQVIFSQMSADGSERKLGKAASSLQPERSSEVTFSLQESGAISGVYKATVQLAEPSAFAHDALIEDNAAWVSASTTVGSRLLVIDGASSSPAASDAIGLGRIEGLSVTQISAPEYSKLSSESLKRYSLLVFHRSAPTVAPLQSTLLVLPPQDNPFFPVKREVGSAKIASWMNEHPVTLYLKVPLLTIGNAEIFDVPPWGQAVLNAEVGNILVTGESRGVRFAAVGFEIFPFEGTKTPTVSILTLNLVNWLTGGTELSSTTLVGGSYRLESGKKWLITSPSGKQEKFESNSEEVKFYPLKEPGVYLFREGGEQGESSLRMVTSNLFYPEESSTQAEQVLRVKRYVKQASDSRDSAQPLWPIFLTGALLLLALELLQALLRPEKLPELRSEAFPGAQERNG